VKVRDDFMHIVGVDGVVAPGLRQRQAATASEDENDRPKATTERLPTDPLDIALLATPDIICGSGAVLRVLSIWGSEI
jgi:hypothetical protein